MNFEPAARINNQRYKLFEKGVDSVVFLSAMNKGEGLKRLSEFASGGELSRILLSLKGNKLNDKISPVLILDEIDTGISGEVAQKVGTILKKLGKNHQVIAITHLPQVAAKADRHFFVYKNHEKAKTLTEIKVLKTNLDDRSKNSLIFIKISIIY